ncbi:uncharacterized protein [Oscarella lobularis]|uniref:uncharacterized protein n=1 Tax=Oscarella lobularis TaxID=121494 RepID=UPI003313730A
MNRLLLPKRRLSTTNRRRLVILGTGWGGYSLLKNVDRKKYDVTVVSPRNHFLFTPLLASTTVGTLEFRSIIEPIRTNAPFRDERDFHLSEAIRLEPKARTVWCRSVIEPSNLYPIAYDNLVIAVGAVPNSFGVPGVEKNAFFLKELADARAIRNQIIVNFELAVQPGRTKEQVRQLLHFVIVGGGPTGVEFGAELHDFIKQDIAKLFATEMDDVKVSLVEASQILPSFDKRLQRFAEKRIQQREKMELLRAAVTDVRPKEIVLSDGSVVPCGLTVWAAGISARPFTLSLDLPKTKQSQILVDNCLHVKGDSSGSIFALGDCASVEGDVMPPTAQVAERQGRYLAKALSSYADNKESHVVPFKFRNSGMLAYVGGWEAVTDVPHIKFGGFHSWLLWRSAYLTRLGSWRLRLQVPVDWFKSFFYGRDISRF